MATMNDGAAKSQEAYMMALTEALLTYMVHMGPLLDDLPKPVVEALERAEATRPK